MNCPTCSTAMKPLFTGFYCPKDCDKGAGAGSVTSSGPSKVFIWNGKKWRVTSVSKAAAEDITWRSQKKHWFDAPIHAMTQEQFEAYGKRYWFGSYPGLKHGSERTDGNGDAWLWKFEQVN